MNGSAMARQVDTLLSASSAPLSVLLARMKTELDSLTQIVGDMQTGLSPLLVDASLGDPEKCRHAQNLDLVWQTLESLSRVLHAAACAGASQHPVDIDAIAEDLPLADLAARLRGRIIPTQAYGNDLDLF
jgi:hypothetical protein